MRSWYLASEGNGMAMKGLMKCITRRRRLGQVRLKRSWRSHVSNGRATEGRRFLNLDAVLVLIGLVGQQGY